ncbi:MAG: hypothetical protein K6357_07800 [Elusimicrobiota bacterium]
MLSKVKIFRNIFPYKFINKETEKNFLIIKEKITSALKETEDFGKKINIETVSNQTEKLIEKQIIDKDDKIIKNAIIIKTGVKNLFLLSGVSEHILIVSIKNGLNIENAYKLASTFEKKLSKHLIFSWSKKFGFLGTDLLKIPHQIEIKLVFSIPAIYYSNLIEEFYETFKPNLNNISALNGGLLPLSYGFIETSFIPQKDESIHRFIKRVNETAKAIEEMEKKNSEFYISKKHENFIDMVFKSCGTLKYAKKLDYNEFLSLISKFLWGKNAGIIKSDYRMLIENFFELGDKNLAKTYQKASEKRSEIIKRLIYFI